MAAGSRGGGLVGSISDEPAPQTRGKPRGMAAGSCAFGDLARSCWGSGGFGGIAGGGGRGGGGGAMAGDGPRSEEHTSELQSLMRISYAVFCLKKKKTHVTT